MLKKRERFRSIDRSDRSDLPQSDLILKAAGSDDGDSVHYMIALNCNQKDKKSNRLHNSYNPNANYAYDTLY